MGPQSGPMAAPRELPTVNVSSISRVSGLLLGLSLALVALVGAHVPAGTGEVPAFASLKAEPSVELGIAPVGRELLSERRLAPGELVSGLVQVSNLTGASLLAIARFHPSVRLRPRQARSLRFRISSPRAHEDEIAGRSFALSIRWSTKRAGR